MKSQAEYWQKIHNNFSDIFTGIGCFKGTIKLQVREDSCLYQVQSRRVAYALQEPIREELDRLQKRKEMVLLDVDEISEWCKSFLLVLKANCKVKLCLNQARLNKVLIRPIHRGLTLNDILPSLAGINYLMLIDGSPGYHNINLDEQPSYLTNFSCPFGR